MRGDIHGSHRRHLRNTEVEQLWQNRGDLESYNDNTWRFILGVGHQIAGTMKCACFDEVDQDTSG